MNDVWQHAHGTSFDTASGLRQAWHGNATFWAHLLSFSVSPCVPRPHFSWRLRPAGSQKCAHGAPTNKAQMVRRCQVCASAIPLSGYVQSVGRRGHMVFVGAEAGIAMFGTPPSPVGWTHCAARQIAAADWPCASSSQQRLCGHGMDLPGPQGISSSFGRGWNPAKAGETHSAPACAKQEASLFLLLLLSLAPPGDSCHVY